MKKGLVLAIVASVMWIGSAEVCAVDYYVDATDGNDSWNGNYPSYEGGTNGPWQTLGKVNSYTFQTGKNVFLKCGGTWAKQNINVDWTGTSENNVVIGAYYMDGGNEIIGVNGDGKPIIDGENTYPSSYNSALLRTSTTGTYEYITFQDIHVKRSFGAGITAYETSSHVTVQRCKVEDTYKTNIKFYHSDFGTALYNECKNGAVERQPGDLHWQCGGVQLSTSNYGTAMYNYIYNQHGEGIGIGNHDTVMFNLVVDTRSVGLYLNGQHDSEVAYNMVVGTNEADHLFYNEWHAAGLAVSVEPSYPDCKDNKIHHNIVINTFAGIRMFNVSSSVPPKTIDNIYIYNNTFIDNRNAFHMGNANDWTDNNIRIKNNIIYSKHIDAKYILTYGEPINNWDIDYNVWFGKAPPSGIWSGAHDQTSDPNFPKSIWKSPSFTMNDFTASDCVPQAGSLAIDTGANLGSPYKQGLNSASVWPNNVSTLDQNNYGTGWEIGAYVWSEHLIGDFDGDGCVDIADLSMFVEFWLQCNDPQNPDCEFPF